MRRLVDWRDAGVEFGDLFREKGSKLLSYGCDRWQVWQGWYGRSVTNQADTLEKTDCSWLTEELKLGDEKEMKSWFCTFPVLNYRIYCNIADNNADCRSRLRKVSVL
jgi:hypothetical protein